jgi:hypothetical protein
MTPFPEQLRAFMLASPGIEAEATRGSPEKTHVLDQSGQSGLLKRSKPRVKL